MVAYQIAVLSQLAREPMYPLLPCPSSRVKHISLKPFPVLTSLCVPLDWERAAGHGVPAAGIATKAGHNLKRGCLRLPNHFFSCQGSKLKTDLALSWGILELYKKDDLGIHQVVSGPLVFLLSRVLGEEVQNHEQC